MYACQIKYEEVPSSHYLMTLLILCLHLTETKSNIEVLSLDELDEIGVSAYVTISVFMCRLAIHFWARDYFRVAEISECFVKKNPASPNRTVESWRKLYEGVTYFHLARDTKEMKWRVMGERAIMWFARIAPLCPYNYENKLQLLQAELHYLEGNLESAEASYEASIVSANDSRILPEGALANELFGIFCVENQMVMKGMERLLMALELYRRWGAIKKVKELQQMIDITDEASRMYKSKT